MHKIQGELSHNFDLDFDILALFRNRKEVTTERTINNTNSNNKSKNKFKVAVSLKLYLVDEINELIKKMNLNKDIEKKVLLNKDKTCEEIEMIFAELTNQKKRRRNKRKNKSFFIKMKKEIKADKPFLGRKKKEIIL